MILTRELILRSNYIKSIQHYFQFIAMTFTKSKNQKYEAYVAVHLIRASSVSNSNYNDIPWKRGPK